jgi:hypothetical protein
MTDQIWRSGPGSSVASFETRLYGTITIDISAFGKNPSIAGISGDDYSPSPIGSTYHEYRSEFRTGVLANEKSLSEMQHLLKEQPTPVTKTFAGPGYVFDGTPAGVNYVVNVTEYFQHLLNPGVVKREVIVDRAEYVIVTTGIGTGAFPSINVDPTIGGIVWGIAGLLGFGSHQLPREYNPYPVIVGVVPNGFGASVNVIYTGYTGKNTGYDSPSEGNHMPRGQGPSAPHTIADGRAIDRDSMKYYVDPKKVYNSPSEGQHMRPGTNNGSNSHSNYTPTNSGHHSNNASNNSNNNSNYTPTNSGHHTNNASNSSSNNSNYTPTNSGHHTNNASNNSSNNSNYTPTNSGHHTPTNNNSNNSHNNSSNNSNGGNGNGRQSRVPILLDLDGNGFDIGTLDTSSTFVASGDDGLVTCTAWARGNDGVLVIDADGDGKISSDREYVFTEWAEGARTDFEGLKLAFDTNHNGKLDAGDSRFAEFKVSVGGQLKPLAELGITSIDLTPRGSGQTFADGSKITGVATFTHADGTTGEAGDATLMAA